MILNCQIVEVLQQLESISGANAFWVELHPIVWQ